MDVGAANNASDTFGSKEIIMTFELVYTMVVLILPLILLVGLNVRLIQELQGAKHRLRSYSKEYSGVNEDNITIVMVVIVLTLVFCHTPDRILQIIRWMLVKSPLDCPNPFFYAVNISNLLIVFEFVRQFHHLLRVPEALPTDSPVEGVRVDPRQEEDSSAGAGQQFELPRSTLRVVEQAHRGVQAGRVCRFGWSRAQQIRIRKDGTEEVTCDNQDGRHSRLQEQLLT